MRNWTKTGILCWLFFAAGTFLSAQSDLLQAGPMVGYSEMREVMLWVQTRQSCEVQIEYWEKGTKEKMRTQLVETHAENGFTAHLLANQVQPGKKYAYNLLLNGKELKLNYPTEFQALTLWQHRTDPPDVRIALGSCAYISDPEYDRPGDPYGGDYQIFSSISQKSPDLMLWLGDNVYFREADWNTRTGIYYRYTRSRSLPELQPLLANVHHYAIWDDHDFGPNDADRSFIYKPRTLQAFKDFWANPNYGHDGAPGVFGTFEWADAQFFLLDNRYHRTPNGCETCACTWLGEAQFQWLIDALKSSTATFKFVAIGGQVLSGERMYETLVNQCELEQKRLLEALKAEKIEGVVFLDGDRHHTELSRLERPGAYPLYDFTVSPLTSGAHGNDPEVNENYVEGTFVGKRNFAILELSGPADARKMKLMVYDSDGKELWNRTIQAKELKFPDQD